MFFNGFIDPQSITDKLIPNGVWPFIIQLISTFVMLLIVKKYLYKPMKAMLDKRANFVETQLTSAEKNQREAEKLKALLQREQIETKATLQALREQAEKDIDDKKARLLEEAQAQIAALKLKAEADILAAKNQAQADIEHEIVHIALSASKEVLKRELNDNDHDRFVTNFIKDLKN